MSVLASPASPLRELAEGYAESLRVVSCSDMWAHNYIKIKVDGKKLTNCFLTGNSNFSYQTTFKKPNWKVKSNRLVFKELQTLSSVMEPSETRP